MNTTYARRIKRIQTALISGLKTLIDIFALAEGVPNVIGNYELKLTPIITVEDNRRDELLQNKIRNVNDMMSLISDFENIDETTRLKIILDWLSKYLNQQDIVDIINEYLQEVEKEQKDLDEEQATSDNNGPDFDFKGGPGGSSRSDININNNLETNEPENTPETNEPELAPQEDLAEVEGEDLL